MNNKLTPRDIQTLSDYLDGRLNRKEQSSLEIRLQSQTELRDELEALKQTRLMLQTLPRRRAPHNFTLSLSMVPRRPAPRLFPAFSMASALAGLLLVAVFLGNYFVGGTASSASRMAINSAAPLAQQNYSAVATNIANPTLPIITWGTPTYPAKAFGLGGGGAPAAASPIAIGTAVPGTDQTESQPAAGATPASGGAPGNNPSSTPANPPAVALAPLVQAPAATEPAQTTTPHAGAPVAGLAVQPNAKVNNSPILGVQPTENQGQISATSAPAQEEPGPVVSIWRLAEAGAGLLTVVLVLLALYFYRKERL